VAMLLKFRNIPAECPGSYNWSLEPDPYAKSQKPYRSFSPSLNMYLMEGL